MFTLTWHRRGHRKMLFLKNNPKMAQGLENIGQTWGLFPRFSCHGPGDANGQSLSRPLQIPLCDLYPHLLPRVSFSHESFWSLISAQERVPGMPSAHTGAHCPMSHCPMTPGHPARAVGTGQAQAVTPGVPWSLHSFPVTSPN